MASSDLPAIDSSKALLSFLGIRQKDLPYRGNCGSSASRPALSPFSTLHQKQLADMKDDQSRLITDLTGVTALPDCLQTVPVLATKPRRSRSSNERTHFENFNANRKSGSTTPREIRACIQSTIPAVQLEEPTGPSVPDHCLHLEKAIDTSDLSFWTCMVLPDRSKEDESYTDMDGESKSEFLEAEASERAVSPDKLAPENGVNGKADERTIREEYRSRLKEAMSFVQLRTQMLQELSFGEVMRNDIVEGKGSHNKQESDSSFMSGTSVVVKHARRLAGLMHTEEQALGLQDLYQWLQNIGKLLGEEADVDSKKSSLFKKLDNLRLAKVLKDSASGTPHDMRTSSTPYEPLQQVQHDVRDRLANLYQGKNFLLSRQAEMLSSAKVASESDNPKELSVAMERLQKMEEAYEILGTTILNSLKEAEKMEEEFHMLQNELQASGCPLLIISNKKKSKKSSRKNKGKTGQQAESDSLNNESSQSETSSAISSSRISSDRTNLETNGPGSQEQGIDQNSTLPTTSETKGTSESKVKNKSKSSSQKKEKKKILSGDKALVESSHNPAEDKKQKEINKSDQGGDSLEATHSEATTVKIIETRQSLSSGTTTEPIHVAASAEGRQAERPDEVAGSASGSNKIESVSPAEINIVGSSQPPSSEAVGSPESRQISSESEPLRRNNDALEEKQTGIEAPRSSIHKDAKIPDSVTSQYPGKQKRKSRRISTQGSRDEVVQTDDVAILSLHESLGDSLLAQSPESVDITKLLEDLRKLQKQLQFWRTKNWVEKHYTFGQLMPASAHTFTEQFNKVDPAPDMGLVFYYNPITGFHTMKIASDLEPSMQQYFSSLAAASQRSGFLHVSQQGPQ